MNESTARAEAKDPPALHRRSEARHADQRPRRREVHDLEAMQASDRLAQDPPLHSHSRCQIDTIDFGPAGMLLHHPSEPACQKRRRWPDELRPHLLDVPIAQSPTIIGLSRDRNDVQSRLFGEVIHDLVKACDAPNRDAIRVDRYAIVETGDLNYGTFGPSLRPRPRLRTSMTPTGHSAVRQDSSHSDNPAELSIARIIEHTPVLVMPAMGGVNRQWREHSDRRTHGRTWHEI